MKYILIIVILISSCISVTKKQELFFDEGDKKTILEKFEITDWDFKTFKPENWTTTVDTNGVIIEMPQEFNSGFSMHAGYIISQYTEPSNIEYYVNGTRDFLKEENHNITRDSSFKNNKRINHLFEIEVSHNDTLLRSQIYFMQRESDIIRMNFTFIEPYENYSYMFKYIVEKSE